MSQLVVLFILVVNSLAPQVAVIENLGERSLTRAHLSFIIKLRIPPHVSQNIQAARILTQKIAIREDVSQVHSTRARALKDSIMEYEKTSALLQHRDRRGLLDVGGLLLKGVFGVATDEDLQLLSEDMKNATDAIISTQRAILLQSDVLKKAMLHSNNVLGEEISRVESTVQGLVASIQTADQLSLITETLMNVQAIFTRYYLIMESLKSGKVDNFISVATLWDLYNSNVDKIPKGLKVPCFRTDQCNVNTLITVSGTRNNFLFVGKLPLVSTETFSINEFTRFPVEDASSRFFVAHNLPRFMGSNDHHYFLSENLECNQLFCSGVEEIIDLGRPACNLDLLAQLTPPSNCKYREITPNHYHVQRSSFSWVVFFFEDNDVTVICPDSGRTEHVRASGLFVIPRNCELFSGFLRLAPTLDIESGRPLLYKGDQTARHFRLDPNATNIFINDTHDRTRFLEKIQRITNALESNISDIRESNSIILSTTTQVSFNLITVALVLLAIGIGFCVIKRWMKTRNHPLQYQPAIPIADLPTVRGTL